MRTSPSRALRMLERERAVKHALAPGRGADASEGMVPHDPSPLLPLRSNEQHARFESLMTRVATDRDRAAFAELFAFYAPRLKAYVLRLGGDEARAIEIARDVMIAVWRTAKRFDAGQGSVSTWIFRIARNRRIDAHAQSDKHAVEPDELVVLPAAWTGSGERIDARSVERSVRSAMLDLPIDELDLLQLAFYEGRTHREISALRGLPLGVVQARIGAVLCKLQANLPAR